MPIKELHKKACGWFESSGYKEEAFIHAIKGEEYEKAVSLLEELTPLIFENYVLRALIQHINLIPESYSRHSCELQLYKAWELFLTGDSAQAWKTILLLKEYNNINKYNTLYGSLCK